MADIASPPSPDAIVADAVVAADPAAGAVPVDASPAEAMTLFVCTTCRDAAHRPDAPAAGARLYAAIAAAPAEAAIRVVPVECLSVCRRTCAVGFAAPGKWTYVYGDLPADTAAGIILQGARLYAIAPDGIIPWKIRPDALKKGAVARIPPLAAAP
jgi:predicted metal-binding protein